MKIRALLIIFFLFAAGDALAWGVRYPCARWIADDDRIPIPRPKVEEDFDAPRALPPESARSVEMLFELTARVTEMPAAMLPGSIVEAQNVNDFDEAPDSAWFTNRIGRRQMSNAEIAAGPGRPQWRENGRLMVRALGTTHALNWLVANDDGGKTFLIILDSPRSPERATGAGMIASRALHALGYNIAPMGLFSLAPSRLVLSGDSLFRDETGQTRPATDADLRGASLAHGRNAPPTQVRALVTQKPDGVFLGPFSYSGRHRNDPNDRIPHQHRRELRGLYLFSAWVDNRLAVESRTADIFVKSEADGSGYVLHYLFGFEGSLGNFERAQEESESYVHPSEKLIPVVMGLPNITLYTKKEKKSGPIQRQPFDVEGFDPAQWTTALPNSAFSNRVARDSIWAAFVLSNFTDEKIAAIVETAQFSDRRFSKRIEDTLKGRRDKLLEVWFSKQSPLTDFVVSTQAPGCSVAFTDAAALSGLPGTSGSTYRWRLRSLNGKATLSDWRESATPCAAIDDSAMARIPRRRLQDLEIGVQRPGERWPMPSVHVLLRKVGDDKLEIAGITRPSGR